MITPNREQAEAQLIRQEMRRLCLGVGGDLKTLKVAIDPASPAEEIRFRMIFRDARTGKLNWVNAAFTIESITEL